ncbi:hypothetical protein U1Q18_010312 [Sarracenia purpurea var. burkii]
MLGSLVKAVGLGLKKNGGFFESGQSLKPSPFPPPPPGRIYSSITITIEKEGERQQGEIKIQGTEQRIWCCWRGSAVIVGGEGRGAGTGDGGKEGEREEREIKIQGSKQ